METERRDATQSAGSNSGMLVSSSSSFSLSFPGMFESLISLEVLLPLSLCKEKWEDEDDRKKKVKKKSASERKIRISPFLSF